MSYELKNIKILGYTTDFQKCECCGREVKGTVALLDVNSEVILHFGATCAVNANKYDSLEALEKAKKEINALKSDLKRHTEFVYYCIRKFRLDRNKLDNILSEYIKHAMNPETRTKRYNWEKWKM